MELKRRSCSRLRVSQVEQSVKENWRKIDKKRTRQRKEKERKEVAVDCMSAKLSKA